MAKFRPDLRKLWRAAAGQVQQDNVDRLLAGESVEGGQLLPRAVGNEAGSSSRRRVRYRGVRVALKAIGTKPGVGNGDMLRDLTRKSNAKCTRTGFRITPSKDVILKQRAFVAGDRHQPPRPFCGISSERIEEIRRGVQLETRDQLVRHMNAELERERARGIR